MKKQKLYNIFFPTDKQLPLRKFRWHIMIMVQELSMCKYKAVLKFYYKKSYRRDIRLLRDILSKGKLTSEKTTLSLREINFSHEINYPKWVEKLKGYLYEDLRDYKRIEVFNHEGRYIVIDGNHRLKALKSVFNDGFPTKVLLLKYK